MPILCLTHNMDLSRLPVVTEKDSTCMECRETGILPILRASHFRSSFFLLCVCNRKELKKSDQKTKK